MPRQPRKETVPYIEPPLYYKIISWIKNKPLNFFIIILVVVALILYLSVILKTSVKEPVLEPPKQVITVNPTNSIEIQLEKHSVLIQKLENENNVLENNLRSLEKRHQAHTDLLKRLCEYIIVITVDKKIIPRQCLPEYKWGKEEYGN